MSYRKFTVDVANGRLDFNDDHYFDLDSTRCALGIVSLVFNSEHESIFVAYGVTQHVYCSIDWAWRTSSWGLNTAYGLYQQAASFVPEQDFSSDITSLVVKTIGEGVSSGNLDPDQDIEDLWELAIEFMKDNPELFDEKIYKKFEAQLA